MSLRHLLTFPFKPFKMIFFFFFFEKRKKGLACHCLMPYGNRNNNAVIEIFSCLNDEDPFIP